MEKLYKQKRLHSSLGYLPSVEFEAIHARRPGVDLATGPRKWVRISHSYAHTPRAYWRRF